MKLDVFLKWFTRVSAILATVPLLAAPVVQPTGVTRKWIGAGADALASNVENWEGSVAPAAGDDVLLDATGTAFPMTWDLDVPLASWTQDGYTNAVTIATVYGSVGFTNLLIAGDCRLQSGKWGHLQNDEKEQYRLRATIGGNLTIGPEASIRADGRGFSRYNRPDGVTIPSWTGGAHGGSGGYANRDHYAGSLPYGSIYRPENLGSGGTWGGAFGGGAIYLDVGGAFVHQGAISADSVKAQYYTGAGGSVLVCAGSIEGNGTLSASAATATGGGGGGRVAVILRGAGSDFSRYDLPRHASAYSLNGACGTIYGETATDQPGHGWLVMKGDGKVTSERMMLMTLTSEDAGEIDLARITLTNAAYVRAEAGIRLRLDRSCVVEAANGPSDKKNGFVLDGGELVFPDVPAMDVGYAIDYRDGMFIHSPSLRFMASGALVVRGDLTYGASLVFGENSGAMVSSPLHVTGDLVFKAGARATHDGPSIFDPGDRLEIAVSGNMTVEEGASLSALGKGYKAPHGGPDGNKSAGNGGASHGGITRLGGGGVANAVYGSIYHPATYGSAGSSGDGGGWVRLSVGGALRVDGSIDANGGKAKDHYSGAGGSVDITAGSLTGAGSISADAGEMRTPYGPSGGGRVAVRLTAPGATFAPFAGTIHAYGGSHPNDKRLAGGAGTVYLQDASQAVGEGTLLIDSGPGPQEPEITPIGGAVEGTSFGNVVIRGKARLVLEEDTALSVSGLFTNGASFSAASGSIVSFGGEGESLIAGDSVFCGLKAVTPGKRIRFAAGSTQAVTGVLALAGTAADPVLLSSTVPGSPWKLDLSGHESVRDVSVADSDASSGKTVVAIAGNDRGGNVNWTFREPVVGDIVWTGGADSSWNNGANWAAGYAPGALDSVLIPASASHMPRLDLDTRVGRLTIAAGATLALDGHDLAVSGDLSAPGGIVASGAETLRVGGDLFVSSFSSARSVLFLDGTSRQVIRAAGTSFATVCVENNDLFFASSVAAVRLDCRGGSPARRLVFAPGTTARFHVLSIDGPAELASSVPGDRWGLSVSEYSIRDVRVSDCDASAGVTIRPVDSSDGGNNLGWAFADTRKRWTGGATGDFADGANWAGGAVPSPSDDLYLVGDTTAVLSDVLTIGALTVGAGATVEFRTNVTVAGSVTVEDGGTIVWDKPGVIRGGLVLLDGSRMTHSPCGRTEANKIDLSIAGSGYIAPGGVIDVTGKGHAGKSGPGFAGNTGSSHGGRGNRGTVDVGPCYGSIVSPTNCGSGGNWGVTPGGGAIRLAFGGELVLEGKIIASGENDHQQHYDGTGGSIYLSAGRLFGGGMLQANGGQFHRTDAGALSGGGRIAVKLTDPAGVPADFSGLMEVYPGRSLDLKHRAAVGTVYLELASEGGGRGLVVIDRQRRSNLSPLTDFPSTLLCEEKESFRTRVLLRDGAVMNLTRDTTVEDIRIEGDAPLLKLNGHTLTVRQKPHALGENENKQVVPGDGGQILWIPRGGPLLLLIR